LQNFEIQESIIAAIFAHYLLICYFYYKEILYMDTKVFEIAKQYANTVKEHIPTRMVVLYGSHATGNARKNSDIDIAVVVDEPPADYLQSSAHLFALVRNIDKRIEPVLIVKTKDRGGFLDSILQYGNVIYQANN
jgi:predicted nucleotidyltransferase